MISLPTARALIAVAAVLLAAGCVGSTAREAFEDDVRARGAGITEAELTRALDRVAVEVAAGDAAALEILDLRVNAEARNLVVQARRGDQPEFVDTIVLRGDEVLSSEPVQDADRFDLDELAIAVADVPLDQTESIIDRAVAEFGDDGTLISAFTVRRLGGDPAVLVDLESPRRTGTVTFDLDGSLRTEEDGS